MDATQRTIESNLGQIDPLSIGLFVLILLVTLGITFWASRRTQNTEDFYTAGQQIGGFQNGLALSGDFLSASSFLGFTGLVALYGFDGVIYTTGGLMGWPLLLFLLAEPLRNLGKYTFADILAFRMRQKPIRLCASVSSLMTVMFYLMAQMIGAGYLIRLLFGLSYEVAEISVGAIMLAYVLWGGMLATTWVQIIKAVLLLVGAISLGGLVLAQFNFNPAAIVTAAVEAYGEEILEPGALFANQIDMISLGLAFMLGTAGMPHVLMRFYTVKDAKAARKSAFIATGFIAIFYTLIFIIGFGAMAIVGKETIMSFDKAGNVALFLTAEAVGGDAFLGILSAVAFATILAVVAGLTLSGAASLSHDVWSSVIRRGEASEKEQLNVAKISSLFIGISAIVLGIVFKGQNVAMMAGLAFAVAASGNFPAIILSTFWRRCTTQGAVSSIVVGTFSSVMLIILSPTVMVDVLGFEDAIFPLKNPGIYTIPLSFFVGIVVSLTTKDLASERNFIAMERRMHLGVEGEHAGDEISESFKSQAELIQLKDIRRPLSAD